MTLSSKEVREKFLSYFESKDHRRVRSSSLVPVGDPTLLFTNAGMNQFKDVFTGKVKPQAPRATSAQKCMRVSGKHNDLENVGRTARHHTFFEMLGNFSFGDYFKQDAIRFAWELITDVYALPVDKLWITVFREDDEAYNIWTKDMGVDPARVVRMDEKDNFWSMGDVGPCGPCSEIHIDQGDGPGDIWKGEDIYGDSDRFLELWNLVFMQFERHPDGSMTPLPKPSVDTGGGLERFAAVLQGKYSNYESDLFTPIIAKTAEMCDKRYRDNTEDDTSLQVIADHVRATTFLIGDGMLPSNLHRGYVLRRIMRRAIRHGHRLGFNQVFMPEICELVIREMGEAYPELQRNRDFILKVVREEEKGFRRTLNSGLEILNEEIRKLEESGELKIPGEAAFKLYDTFGFPIDLTEIIAGEHNKGVDIKGFEKAMEAQRERGRSSWKGQSGGDMGKLYGEALAKLSGPVGFCGYEKETDQAALRAIISGEQLIDEAVEGMDVELVFERTPFYGESGGQVGDRGLILSGSESEGPIAALVDQAATGQTPDFTADTAVLVLDVQRPLEGLVVHRGRVLKGSVKAGDTLTLLVDGDTRRRTRANHSATHLLHHALRDVLGSHVKQAGSWVGPERLRFDFSHFQGIEADEMDAIEQTVTRMIVANTAIETAEKSLETAQKEGAIAFFGDKYGDRVRVVSMGDGESVELCGGTHAARTGDIGPFKIIAEASIASGVRRIEALTGLSAMAHIQRETNALKKVASILSVIPTQTPEGVRGLMDQIKQERKQVEQLQREKAALQAGEMIDMIEEINGINVLCAEIEDVEPKAMRDYGQQLLDKMKSGVLLLALPAGDKLNLLLGVSEDHRKTLPAGKAIAEVAAAAGGKGGGRPDMAQAGGADASKVADAFAKLKELVAGL